MKPPASYRGILGFGIFEFDPSNGELRKNGLKIRLGQQSAKLLRVLLNSEGRLCTREALRRELWPTSTFGDFERNLNKTVWGLRQALGDFAISPRYIETVAGQGYRFLALSQDGNQLVTKGRKGRKLESLAVIPPTNVNGPEECSFLAGQLACRLTNRLCQVRGARVLAYATVKQYNLSGADPRSAGRELGVDTVLTGEILQRDGDLVVNLELINIRDGTQIWGTQLKELGPQAADRAEQIAEEIAQPLQLILGRSRKPVTPKAARKQRSLRAA